jgi:pimeloyl-ACP methyl ester carboxylesterase
MSSVTSLDGARIAFTRTGSGPALIVVDGALCSRAFGPSAKLAALLAAHFTVYTCDRRGRGESGDAHPYSTVREVEDRSRLKDAARAIAGIIPGAQHRVLSGQSHNVKPGVLTPAVVEFLTAPTTARS